MLTKSCLEYTLYMGYFFQNAKYFDEYIICLPLVSVAETSVAKDPTSINETVIVMVFIVIELN